jgi:hypothetical protein
MNGDSITTFYLATTQELEKAICPTGIKIKGG